MRGSEFDEAAFFAAIEQSGVRALLIGRKALVALGMPVLTGDYDFWIHIDDVEAFNLLAEPFELYPNHPPAEARARGRYALENDEHVDVLVAREQTTKQGVRLAFDEAWRDRLRLDGSPAVVVPSLEHLILTKEWAMRPRDAEDIRFIEGLRKKGKP